MSLFTFNVYVQGFEEIMSHLEEVEAKLDALHEKGDAVIVEFRAALQHIKEHLHEPEVIARILAKSDAQLGDYQRVLDEAKLPVEPPQPPVEPSGR